MADAGGFAAHYIIAKGDMMNVDTSLSNPLEKRTILPGCVAIGLHFLGMFWLTELALLMVVLYGLYAGWSAPQQWSDGFFVVATALVIGGLPMVAPSREALDAYAVRYIANGNTDETRRQLFLESLHNRNFGIRAFLGGMLAMLIAVLVLWA